jgi:hypothetical protein
VNTPLLTALLRAVQDQTVYLTVSLAALTRSRLRQPRERADGGYSTETVLVTALLVMLAVAALAMLTSKVLAKVNSIDLG